MKERNRIVRTHHEDRHRPVFVDLKNDYAFKFVFATPGHEEALLQLVNCILPEKDIVSVRLSAQEQMGDGARERRGIFDVSCRTQSGEYLEIEMQVRKQKHFGDRMVFYSSFPVRNFVGELDNGDYAFTPVYVIGILDFILPDIKPNDNFLNSYSIRNDHDSDAVLTDHLHYITIELPKFRKTLEQLENRTEEMAFIFNNIGSMKEIPPQLQGKGFEKLFEMSKFAAMDEKEIKEYYARQKDIIDQKAALHCAVSEGLEKGMEKGLEKGMEAKSMEIAMAMKMDGQPLELIQRYTGLSADAVRSL